jgi:hypothetical protein
MHSKMSEEDKELDSGEVRFIKKIKKKFSQLIKQKG